MKKRFVYVVLFLVILIFFKFFLADYSIKYKIGEYEIFEKSNGDYMYFEIKYDNQLYNYMVFSKRKLTKKRVVEIQNEEVNYYNCLKPVIKGIDSYFVCRNGEDLVSYEVALNQDNYIKATEDFKYYKNLSNEEHMYIWKYDGFYYLNGDKNYKSINIFKNSRYSNDLMIKINNYLVFPKYDNNYLFSDLVILDMSNGEYEIVETEYKINYDSYYVGNRKSSIFLFDNKEHKLYEINYKKETVLLIGDEVKGFIKYENGKKKDALLSEYVKEKITYFEDIESYYDVLDNSLKYKENDKLKFQFFKNNDITNISSNGKYIYFIYKDKLYKYFNSKSEVVIDNFEFNFNKKNNVFVYNE